MPNLEIRVDLRAHTPIYSQIIAQIEQKIATGELKPGDQLPTVRQLAADLRINFNTVARAYRTLDEARVISTQHGRGTYICEPTDPGALDLLRHHRLSELVQVLLDEAARLGFEAGEVRRVFEEKTRI